MTHFFRGVVDALLNPRSSLEKLYRPSPEGQPESFPAAPTVLIRGRLRARDVATNPPLMIGAVIVLLLFLVVLFGPIWAPTNPYIAAQHLVPHYDVESGEYISPPLPPSPEYPLGTDRWGNDLLSLLMHGARNTLVACAFITMARVAIGLTLGGLAGWNEGKTSDRVVMGAVGIVTSLPVLISSILLIYALDIRKGLPVFIVALSVIGWTEIAQYIRSEFLVLRKRPFIEGAHAVGLGGLGVAVRHVLPNVLPQLLVIACLEMGAVMMLLGGLGFVGVFIGGGSRIAIETDPFTFEFRTLVETPEWGAMLADGFRWLRSRPFVVVPPAIAFFVSVVGFNALGEGLRQLIEKGGINTAFLLRKRMLLVVAGLVWATVFIIRNTGPAPWFARVAQAFSGDLAYEHVQALVEMDGRGAGQDGAQEAAAYIAAKFRAYGLEPGWKRSSYVYPLSAQLVRPVDQPYLALTGPGAVREFRHQIDFGFVTEGHGGNGMVEAPLTFVSFWLEPGAYAWDSFKGLDLRGRVVLLLADSCPPDFANEALIRGARGVLWIAGEGSDECRSQVQVFGSQSLRLPHLPIFCIRSQVADALFEASGYPGGYEASMDALLAEDVDVGAAGDRPERQEGPGWFAQSLSATVRMSLTLSEPQDVEIPCVLGYVPGSDYDLAGQLVILYAPYDGLGVDPNGTVYPAADHNASGVAVLLEIARLWQEQNLDARRSVMFVAWGGGQLQDPGAERFIRQSANFRHLPATALNKPALIFQLEGVGAGGPSSEGDLWIHPQSNRHLAELVEETAAEVGVPVVYGEGDALPGEAKHSMVTGRISSVYLAWSNPGVAPDQDTLERIEPDRLSAVGEALALALTKVVRQTSY